MHSERRRRALLFVFFFVFVFFANDAKGDDDDGDGEKEISPNDDFFVTMTLVLSARMCESYRLFNLLHLN